MYIITEIHPNPYNWQLKIKISSITLHPLFCFSEALYVDELENLLDDFMLSLNTEIDDGSIEEVKQTPFSQSMLAFHQMFFEHFNLLFCD